MDETVRKTLQKQLQLLSERSESYAIDNLELVRLTEAMAVVAQTICNYAPLAED